MKISSMNVDTGVIWRTHD